MGKARTMLSKVIGTITGKIVQEAAEKNAKTAADLKDAVAKARAQADADAKAAYEEEHKTTKAGNGK